MTWRFSKSFSPIPGVRMTLSRSGITTSVGVGPLRISTGSRGASLSARIPGTGVSYHQNLRSRPVPAMPSPQKALAPSAPPVGAVTSSGMHEIRSAAASVIASPGLSAMKETLAAAHSQFLEVERELNAAKDREQRAVQKYQSWASGWLFRKLFKKHFVVIGTRAEEATDEREQLDEMLEQSRVDTHFDMPDEVLHAYERLVEAFERCMSSKRIWDNIAYRQTNQVAERTAATRVVDLKPVTFRKGQCGVINAEMTAPRLQNVTSGDLYLYPGFLVYMVSESTYALVELTEVTMEVTHTKFHEEGPVPSDAEQVGTTWAKVNKDGSPDRRFKDNYAIPVMRYANMTFRSTRGLNEEYMLSNVAAADEFERAWNALIRALKTASQSGPAAPPSQATAEADGPLQTSGVALLAAYVIETEMEIDARAVFGLAPGSKPADIKAAMFEECPPTQSSGPTANAAAIIARALDRFMAASDVMCEALGNEDSSTDSLKDMMMLFPALDETEDFPDYLERVTALRERVEDSGRDGLATAAANQALEKYGATLKFH